MDSFVLPTDRASGLVCCNVSISSLFFALPLIDSTRSRFPALRSILLSTDVRAIVSSRKE